MAAGTAVARLASPPLLARLFSVRALAWLVMGATAFTAGARGQVSAAPAFIFGAFCALLLAIDAVWALQAWGLLALARARIREDGTADVRLISVRPAPTTTVRVGKKGVITTETRRSLIGGAGIAQGWPTHDILVVKSADGGEVARLVPHGAITWDVAPDNPAVAAQPE